MAPKKQLGYNTENDPSLDRANSVLRAWLIENTNSKFYLQNSVDFSLYITSSMEMALRETISVG